MTEYDRIDVIYLGSDVMGDRLHKKSIKVELEIDDLENPEENRKLLNQFLGPGRRVTTAKLIGVFMWIAAENRKRKRKAEETEEAISEVVRDVEKNLPGI